MKKHTLRRIGVGVTTALVMGGLIVGLPETANAAIVTYTCAGATNDLSSSEAQFLAPPINRNSAQTLQLIANTLNNGFSPTPSLLVNVDATIPAGVAPATAFNTSFKFNAALPASLVSAASALGIAAVVVNYANFAVNANGATPSTVTGTAPQQQVNLVAGANVQHTITGTVTPTVAAGGLVVFKAGNAGIKITMNATLGFVTI